MPFVRPGYREDNSHLFISPICNNETDQARNNCGAPPDFYCHYYTISRHDGYDSSPLERCRPVKWLHVKVMGSVPCPGYHGRICGALCPAPGIDPLKKNYDKFRRYYEGFILVFVVYLLVIQAHILFWSAGVQISPNMTFPILFGMLFIYLGFLVEHAEQNWFVGIRTPWTHSSESVWKKTHVLGGELFKIAGLVCLLGALFQSYAIWIIMVPIIRGTIVECYPKAMSTTSSLPGSGSSFHLFLVLRIRVDHDITGYHHHFFSNKFCNTGLCVYNPALYAGYD